MTRTAHTSRQTFLAAMLAMYILPGTFCGARAGTDAPPGSAIVVSGARTAVVNPNVVSAAKSRILNGKSASSCAFLDDPYDTARLQLGLTKSAGPDITKDPVYLAYLSDFGLDNDLSNDGLRTSIYAPEGDVSLLVDPHLNGPDSTINPLTIGTNCTLTDWRVAAGRQRILKNDKTLAQGYEAFDRRDYAQALASFTAAWDKVGYGEAAIMLARIQLYGLGVPKDGARAVRWLEQVTAARYDADEDQVRFDPDNPGAATAKAEAAFMLARIHERGIGVAADQGRARHWYGKAAELGYLPAQDILARYLLAGRGGERNPARGIALLETAGKRGYLPAAYHLGQAYYRGQGVAQDDAQAAAWFGAAARGGLPAAMFAYGHMQDLGEGMPADPAKALVFYKDAALRGDRDAQFALGTYFYTGEVVGGKDPVLARKWFAEAARHGQPDAMFNLGAMLSNGEGGTKDPALAYAWLSLADRVGFDGAGNAVRARGPGLTSADRARASAILGPAVP